MSFSSLNAVNAARGMQGTTPKQPAFGQPYQPPPPGVQAQGPGPQGQPGSSYNASRGMMGTQMSMGNVPAPQMGPARPQPGVAQGSAQAQVNPTNIVAGSTGVNAVQGMPSAVGPQQQMQFDPNDPNSAALAGYMAAR